MDQRPVRPPKPKIGEGHTYWLPPENRCPSHDGASTGKALAWSKRTLERPTPTEPTEPAVPPSSLPNLPPARPPELPHHPTARPPEHPQARPPEHPHLPLARPTKKLRTSHRFESRLQYQKDALGKLVAEHVQLLAAKGFDGTVRELRRRGDLEITDTAAWHPASPLLKRLAKTGAPAVMSTKPWSRRTIEKRIRRGSHQSCRAHLDFLREEMLEFVRKGFWLLLPYRLVKKMKQLRVSPLGVIPQ